MTIAVEASAGVVTARGAGRRRVGAAAAGRCRPAHGEAHRQPGGALRRCGRPPPRATGRPCWPSCATPWPPPTSSACTCSRRWTCAPGPPVSAEALVRWRHPRRGTLLPAEFMPAIEHSELAGGFTLHVVDMALQVAAGGRGTGSRCRCRSTSAPGAWSTPSWRRSSGPGSPGTPCRRTALILEMSESVLDRDEVLVRHVIEDLRSGGVQVSVDDFGTGSASLSFLTRFAVDEVKIDRSFVAGDGRVDRDGRHREDHSGPRRRSWAAGGRRGRGAGRPARRAARRSVSGSPRASCSTSRFPSARPPPSSAARSGIDQGAAAGSFLDSAPEQDRGELLARSDGACAPARGGGEAKRQDE